VRSLSVDHANSSFIVNRLLAAYNREAFKMVERGDATVEDVDTAMKLGAGYRKLCQSGI
jgi:3-hydroxyacyl-CoA dehydrogenase